jgi:hypothetical protein
MWPCRQVAGVRTTFAETQKQIFNIRASYITLLLSLSHNRSWLRMILFRGKPQMSWHRSLEYRNLALNWTGYFAYTTYVYGVWVPYYVPCLPFFTIFLPYINQSRMQASSHWNQFNLTGALSGPYVVGAVMVEFPRNLADVNKKGEKSVIGIVNRTENTPY